MTLVLDPLMSKKVKNPVKAFPLFRAFITSLSHEDLLVSNNTVDLTPHFFFQSRHMNRVSLLYPATYFHETSRNLISLRPLLLSNLFEIGQ